MRSIQAVLPIALLLSAGCITTTEPETAPEATSTAPGPHGPVELVAPEFLPEILLGTFGEGIAGAEPSIAAAPDGTVYVVTPLELWRSDDGGDTYTWLGEPRACVGVVPCDQAGRDAGLRGGGDSDITVTPDGRVHFAGLFDGDNVIPYQYSDDRGETWSDVVDLAAYDSGDREWINARASDGALVATWRENSADDSRTAVSLSYDDGKTWSEPVKAAENTRQGGAVPDPDGGALYLPYDLDGVISVARSFDDGKTWDAVDVTPTAGQRGHIFPVAAVDEAGTVYVVYARDEGSPTPVPDLLVAETDRGLEHPDVHLVVSTDKGASWSEPRKLNADGTTAMFPWIAAGEAGRIVVVWYENPYGTGPVVGQWFTTAAISVDADGAAPTFATSRVSETPAHTGNFCTSGAACLFTGQDRTLLDFFEVAIHPDGHAVVTWAGDADLRRATINVYASRMTAGSALVDPDATPAAAGAASGGRGA